jgi:cytochrome c556
MPESGGDDGAANGGGGESGNAAAPESKSNKVQQGGITDGEEASPRGILEPAQLSNSASQAGGPVTTSHGTASSTAGDEAASEEAGSTISDGITGIGSGAFEAGQQEQMLAMVGNGKTAAQASAPAAVPQPPVVDLKKLKSVRGLSNSPGVYNCFLNVIIQSLWHLPAFRKALLSLTPAELKKHTADNTEVLTSLRAIFEELNQSHSSNGAENDVDDSVPLKPVSPQQLREALGGSRFDHGNMHDAAEVLGELFDRLHVAEVGTQGRDPTLPRTVRVDAASIQNAAKKPRTTKGAATADGSSPLASVVAKDSVWGNAAALKMVKKALALADAEASNAGNKSNGSGGEQKDAVSMVQKLFGMEVQAPVHNTNNTNSTNSTSNGGKGGKSKGGNKNSSSSSAVTATVEVIQFTRYFHLVPAQGLRIAASTAPSFEDALVAATAGGNTPPTERLLTKPSVFTLSTVFESPQVPAPALAATLAALRPELDISRLFLSTPSLNADGDEDEENDAAGDGFKYKLRCMVCYSSSHYFAFAFNEEVGQWLLLDDAHVSAVGQWKDVQATAAQRRLQPSLLFYEAVAAQ